jgi:exodeoxyribonuclease V alpha subunit
MPVAPRGRAETLCGTLERIVFQNAETHFTVARLRVAEQSQLVTVVGNLAGVNAGAAVRLHGQFVVDKKFGDQFRVETYQTLLPATLTGIEKYLGSGLVPGIGPELAKRIVATFGLDTLEVIQAHPERLIEVGGIGTLRATRIRESWQEQRAVQDVMVFLQGHGVSTAHAARIYKRYGAQAISLVSENPYRLALDVWGIGFKTADAIARNLGIDQRSPARAEAGLLHVLGELVDHGHMHVPEEELLEAAEKMLEVTADAILLPAIERLVGAGLVVREVLGERGRCLSLRALHEAETRAALGVVRLLSVPPAPCDRGLDESLHAYEREQRITLAPQQREAIKRALFDKVVVITGGPGVGKTTIVRAILRVSDKDARRVVLCAPTGRAAKRLAETTGRPAMTLHRLLEFQPKTGTFGLNESCPLAADMVIVDEASMIDVPLFGHLLAAIPSAAKLLLVGDVDQLPSVGPGRVLFDVISSERAVVVRLTEIFRQAKESAIVASAHRIHRGELPDLERHAESDFFFVERDEPADILSTVVELACERIPRRFGLDPLVDIQVLTPMHRGEVGTENLNETLQARLNPAREGLAELPRKNRFLRQGDKVMQIRNDYDKDVFNGDVGRVVEIVTGDEARVVVEFDGRQVTYEPDELEALVHAYAMSVHKSQGSEYPAVVVPLSTQHFLLLQRNLLYTAITRGKRLVVLVGSKQALGIAVRTNDTRLRWTWLCERIRGLAASEPRLAQKK